MFGRSAGGMSVGLLMLSPPGSRALSQRHPTEWYGRLSVCRTRDVRSPGKSDVSSSRNEQYVFGTNFTVPHPPPPHHHHHHPAVNALIDYYKTFSVLRALPFYKSLPAVNVPTNYYRPSSVLRVLPDNKFLPATSCFAKCV